MLRPVFGIILSATAAWPQAQVASGDLRGTVVDAANASVANAKVTVTDPTRGISRSVQSDIAGDYRVPLLPPGVYRVRAEAAGFNAQVIDGIEVRVGDTVSLRIQLQV